MGILIPTVERGAHFLYRLEPSLTCRLSRLPSRKKRCFCRKSDCPRPRRPACRRASAEAADLRLDLRPSQIVDRLPRPGGFPEDVHLLAAARHLAHAEHRLAALVG